MKESKLIYAVLFVLALTVGCGGNTTTHISPTDVSDPPTSMDSGTFGLLSPEDALATIPARTSSALTLERNGVEYASGLAQLIADDAPSATYSPTWADNTSGFDNLSYAIYNFNVDGYRGIEEVLMEWGNAPTDYSNLWVGLSQWDSNSWSWHEGSSDGIIEMGGTGYIHYTKPGSGDMFIAVVMLGTEPAILDRVQVGNSSVEDWGIFGHDLQHTRRSPYIGAQTNNVNWSFPTAGQLHSSPVIGADGTVFIASYDGNLYAVNPDGSQKWAFGVGGLVESSAAVGADGTIYIGASVPVKKLFAINPNGTEKWSFAAAGNVISSAAIAADGTIYVGCASNRFYAINPDGTEKWSVPQAGIVESSPAVALDGTIYIGGTDLLALNPDGTEQWTFIPQGVIRSSPSIGADGTIYVGTPDRFFYAVNPDGSEKWVFEAVEEIVSSAAIALDGTVYFGSFGNNLYALNPDGTEKWVFPTAGNVWSSPSVDADGTIYFGVDFGGNKFHAVNPDGTQKWEYTALDRIASSPAIGADGTVYVGGFDGKLYAFKDAL